MNEDTIYQSMSQLVFNAMMRGENKDKAMKDAETTIRELVKKSKAIAKEFGSSEETSTKKSG